MKLFSFFAISAVVASAAAIYMPHKKLSPSQATLTDSVVTITATELPQEKNELLVASVGTTSSGCVEQIMAADAADAEAFCAYVSDNAPADVRSADGDDDELFGAAR